MTRSIQEEIIAALWIIASLIAFSNEYSLWGWIFAIKGAIDFLCAIFFGIMEILIKERAINHV